MVGTSNRGLSNTDPTLDAPISPRRDKKSNAATGASAAGVRAVASQTVAFYFRTPVKAFFRTRVDYLAFARAINPRVQAQESWSLRISTPGLLTHAVRTYGWSFIPNHVLPPMIANVGVGAVLYTSYLQILGTLYQPSSQSLKRIYPPPPVHCTALAGFSAGFVQSIIAAPLDALSVRFRTSDVLSGRYKTMWQYGRSKLREIGPRGVFAGWSLSLVKDSFGYAAFFATFEYVKAQAYYSFVAKYYGDLQGNLLSPILTPTLDGTTKSGQQPPMDANPEGKISKNEQKRRLKEQEREEKKTGPIDVIKPHYAIEPTFLMLAGIAASITQQFVQHPLNLIQNIHYKSLAFLDSQAKIDQPKAAMLRSYYGAYKKTYDQCLVHARRSGGWRRWLYKGFLVNTIKQVPSTSAGLVIFELVRRRYGSEAEAVKIEKDGYDILLT